MNFLLRFYSKVFREGGENKHLIIATYLLVAVSAAMAFYTYKLYAEAHSSSIISDQRADSLFTLSKRQFDLAHDEFINSRESSEKSLKVAENLVEANKKYTQTFASEIEIENRAYLYIDWESFQIEFIPSSGGKLDSIFFSYVGKNVGKTTALDTKKAFYAVIADKFLPPDSFSLKMALKKDIGSPLAQNQNLTLVTGFKTYPKGCLKLVSEGKLYLYIIGCITYYDMYGRFHFTHCYTYYDVPLDSWHTLNTFKYNDSD